MTVRARVRSLAGGPTGPRRRRTPSAAARPPAPPPPDDERRTERDGLEDRMRDSDGPLDRAVYGCGCGFQFTAPVATTVRCPHCGAGQAW